MVTKTKKSPVKKATMKSVPKKGLAARKTVAKKPMKTTPKRTPTTRAHKLSPKASARFEYDEIYGAYEDMKEDIVDSISEVVEASIINGTKKATRKNSINAKNSLTEVAELLYDVNKDTMHIKTVLDAHVKSQKEAAKKLAAGVGRAPLTTKKKVGSRFSGNTDPNFALTGTSGVGADDPFMLVADILRSFTGSGPTYREQTRYGRYRMKRIRDRQTEANKDSISATSSFDVIKASKSRQKLGSLQEKFAKGPTATGPAVGGLTIGDVIEGVLGWKALKGLINKYKGKLPKLTMGGAGGVSSWMSKIFLPGLVAYTQSLSPEVHPITPDMRKNFEKLADDYKKKQEKNNKLMEGGMTGPFGLPSFAPDFRNVFPVTPELRKKFEKLAEKDTEVNKLSGNWPSLKSNSPSHRERLPKSEPTPRSLKSTSPSHRNPLNPKLDGARLVKKIEKQMREHGKWYVGDEIEQQKTWERILNLAKDLEIVQTKIKTAQKENDTMKLTSLRYWEGELISQIKRLLSPATDDIRGSGESSDLKGSAGQDRLEPVQTNKLLHRASFQPSGGNALDIDRPSSLGMTRSFGGGERKTGTQVASRGPRNGGFDLPSPSGRSSRKTGSMETDSYSPDATPSGPAGTFSHKNNNASIVMNTLMKSGMTRAQAEDMTANFMQESGQSLNTSAVGDRERGLNSFGIGQWNRERFAALKKFAESKGKPITDIETQALFAVHELKTTHKKAGNAFFAAKTTEERYNILRDKYEVGIHNTKAFSSAKKYLSSGKYEEAPQADTKFDGKSRVQENQKTQAKTRKRPLASKTKNVLEYAAAQNGVFVDVKSGGQYKKGQGPRTGSTRHDEGNAADFQLYRMVNGKKQYLDMTNKNDLPVIQKFMSDSAAAGFTGFGAHPAYMGEKTFHGGFGKKSYWGAGQSSDGAPEWLKDAVEQGWKKPVDLDQWMKDNAARKTAITETQKPSMKSVPIKNRTLGSIKKGTFGTNPQADEIKPLPKVEKPAEKVSVVHPPQTPAGKVKPTSEVNRVPLGHHPVPTSYSKAVARAKNKTRQVDPPMNDQGLQGPYFG
jgi:hypothetical protein